MGSATPVVMVLIGFALLAALFVYLAVRNADKWRRKMEDILLPIGFAPVSAPSERAALAQSLAIVQPAHTGKRLLKHAYRRADPDGRFTLYVCDYYFGSASGRAGGGNWLLVCLKAETLALARFSVHTLPAQAGDFHSRLFALLGQVIDMPGLQRLQTGDAALDRRHQIFVSPGERTLPVSPALLGSLGDAAGGASVDAGGDTLVLSSIDMLAERMRQTLDPQKVQALLQAATGLYGALRV